MGEYVLIFITLSGVFSVSANVQPIYFHTKEACAAVAMEFNDGPEPSKDNPKKARGSVFGAICRPTR